MKKLFFFLGFLFFTQTFFAQVAINSTGADANPNAMLDISGALKGVLIPRITSADLSTMQNSLGVSDDGLVVYDTDTKSFWVWGWDNGSGSGAWKEIGGGDADFYEEGTNTPPDNINDDIYTMGNVAIGKNTADYPLDIETSTSARGVNTDISGNGNGKITGQNIAITNTGSGTHYGIYDTLGGSGNGKQYGAYHVIKNTGSGKHYGSYIDLSGGSGDKYGAFHAVSGNGFLYGTYNELLHPASYSYGTYNDIMSFGNISGVYNSIIEANPNGSSIVSGIDQYISFEGDGSCYGMDNYMDSYGSGVLKGNSQVIDVQSGSTAIIHGSSVLVQGNGNGTGDVYGFSVAIDNQVGGTHYGVFSNVQKAGSYAGYFIGTLAVGSLSSGTNLYKFPSGRGTAGQIMQTDGSGNLSWISPADEGMLDADFYEVGTLDPPDNITDDIYTLGNVIIGNSATPTARLQVDYGRVAFTSTTDATGTQGTGVLEIGNRLRIDDNEIITNNGTNLNLQYDNDGSLFVDGHDGTFTVRSDNNRVGIGTQAPNELFEVADANNGNARMIVSDGNGSERYVLLLVSPSSSNQFARIDSYKYGTGQNGKTLKINTGGHGDVVIGGNMLPETNKGENLGSASYAWDDIYYDDMHDMGAAAFTDREVTKELLKYKPKPKPAGAFDEKTKKGLKELDPNSVPPALRGGYDLLTDEMTTYNYKANYEQQVQIEKLKKENEQEKKKNELEEQEIKQQQQEIDMLKNQVQKLTQLVKNNK